MRVFELVLDGIQVQNDQNVEQHATRVQKIIRPNADNRDGEL